MKIYKIQNQGETFLCPALVLAYELFTYLFDEKKLHGLLITGYIQQEASAVPEAQLAVKALGAFIGLTAASVKDLYLLLFYHKAPAI